MTPKRNGHGERLNRTMQESLGDSDEALLLTDVALFTRTLADWLVFSNAERPHHALDSHFRSPSFSNINPSAKGAGLID